MKIIRDMSLLALLLGSMGAPAYAQQQETPSRGTQQSHAQQLMGDIAPKMAENMAMNWRLLASPDTPA